MKAGRHNSQATSNNFITVGKAGVSITSEESRFSKTAAAGRSNSEWQNGLQCWDRDPSKVRAEPGAGPVSEALSLPDPTLGASVLGDYQPLAVATGHFLSALLSETRA